MPTVTTVPSGAAEAIAKMQAKYLDHTPIGPMLVACINAFDPTHEQATGTQNNLLYGICPTFVADLGRANVALVNGQAEWLHAQSAALLAQSASKPIRTRK